MFKKGDRVTHPDYGLGTIYKVSPKRVIKQKDKNGNKITHTGIIQVAFDSELGEDDGKGGQKNTIFLSDGRDNIPGSGYIFDGIFYPFLHNIEITKIETT